MLKQTEKRGQRAREDFKTPSTPWYKTQSYTGVRKNTGTIALERSIAYITGGFKNMITVDKLHPWSRCNS